MLQKVYTVAKTGMLHVVTDLQYLFKAIKCEKKIRPNVYLLKNCFVPICTTPLFIFLQSHLRISICLLALNVHVLACSFMY